MGLISPEEYQQRFGQTALPPEAGLVVAEESSSQDSLPPAISGFLGADVPPPVWSDVKQQPSAAPEVVEAVESVADQISEPGTFDVVPPPRSTIHRAGEHFQSLLLSQRIGIMLRPFMKKSVAIALAGAMVPGYFAGKELASITSSPAVAARPAPSHDVAVKPFNASSSPTQPVKKTSNLSVPANVGDCTQPKGQFTFYATANVAVGATKNNGSTVAEPIYNSNKTLMAINFRGPAGVGICETAGNSNAAIITTPNGYEINRSQFKTVALFSALDNNCASTAIGTDKECADVPVPISDDQLPSSEISRLDNMVVPGGPMHDQFMKALDRVFRSNILAAVSTECSQNIQMQFDAALNQWVQAAAPGTQTISFNGSYNSLSNSYDAKTSNVDMLGITTTNLQVSCTPVTASGGQQ